MSSTKDTSSMGTLCVCSVYKISHVIHFLKKNNENFVSFV